MHTYANASLSTAKCVNILRTGELNSIFMKLEIDEIMLIGSTFNVFRNIYVVITEPHGNIPKIKAIHNGTLVILLMHTALIEQNSFSVIK